MAFETFNEQASARGRYLAPRPEPTGGTFSQGEQQQIRWQFSGLLVGALVAEDIVLWTGRVLLGDMWVGEVVE